MITTYVVTIAEASLWRGGIRGISGIFELKASIRFRGLPVPALTRSDAECRPSPHWLRSRCLNVASDNLKRNTASSILL
jgi:hypothetical protein